MSEYPEFSRAGFGALGISSCNAQRRNFNGRRVFVVVIMISGEMSVVEDGWRLGFERKLKVCTKSKRSRASY